MRISALLDQHRHAFIIAGISCPQIKKGETIKFLVDSGCTTTTLLEDDILRLNINCNNLPRSSSQSKTATEKITPCILSNVDLTFIGNYGFLNMKSGIIEVHLNKVDCLPPTHQKTPEEDSLPYSLLEMDVLRHFKKWKFKERELIMLS